MKAPHRDPKRRVRRPETPERRLRVGVLTRGKYGLRLVETIRGHTPFEVASAPLPVRLPDLVEEPRSLLSGLDLERAWDADLLVAYALHPDLALAVVEEAAMRGVKAVILPGGAPLPLGELDRIRRRRPIEVVGDDICCALSPAGRGPEVAEFAHYLGRPRFRLRVKDGVVEEANVLVGAPCGGSWHVASGLVGVPAGDAPRRAALLLQYYPCRAARGGLAWDRGSIHAAAQLTATAVEEALAEAAREGDAVTRG